MEQSIASVAVNTSNEVSSLKTTLLTASAKIDSVQLTAVRAQTAVSEIYDKVETTEKAIGVLSFAQEITDRTLRSHNVLVYGWPIASTPLADAVEFLTIIGYNQHNYVTARRYNSPRRPAIHADKPPILNITFPTVKHARDAMAAYRLHSGGTRDLPYFVKPDLTKPQLEAKQHANKGIRMLLDQEPEKIYRERSGRIAEYKRLANGDLIFDKWIPDPLATTTEPLRERPIHPSETRPSLVALGKRPHSGVTGRTTGADGDSSDIERFTSRSARQGFRRNFSDDRPFFNPASSPAGFADARFSLGDSGKYSTAPAEAAYMPAETTPYSSQHTLTSSQRASNAPQPSSNVPPHNVSRHASQNDPTANPDPDHVMKL